MTAARTAAMAKGQGGALGTLTQLGRNYAMGRSPVQAYRGAMKSFSENLENTSDKYRNDIRGTIARQLNGENGGATRNSRKGTGNSSSNTGNNGNTP